MRVLSAHVRRVAADAGIPRAEVLKKHRLYELWHEYGLFDVEFNSPALEEAYSNQLLVSCVLARRSNACDCG